MTSHREKGQLSTISRKRREITVSRNGDAERERDDQGSQEYIKILY